MAPTACAVPCCSVLQHYRLSLSTCPRFTWDWSEQGGLAVESCQWAPGVGVGEKASPRLTRTFCVQMADSGGLPQVTQVSALQQLSYTGP